MSVGFYILPCALVERAGRRGHSKTVRLSKWKILLWTTTGNYPDKEFDRFDRWNNDHPVLAPVNEVYIKLRLSLVMGLYELNSWIGALDTQSRGEANVVSRYRSSRYMFMIESIRCRCNMDCTRFHTFQFSWISVITPFTLCKKHRRMDCQCLFTFLYA